MKVFNPFNKRELTDEGATMTLSCGSYTGKSSMVVADFGGVQMKNISNTIRGGGRGSLDRHSWDIITECKQVGSMYDNNAQAGRIYSSEELSPSIDTCQGGNRMPKVAHVIGGVGEKKSNGGTQFYMQDRIYDGDIAVSVATGFNPNYVDTNVRIRKLTPNECWRLMDFTDEQFDKAEKVNSASQLYKQAGNSIVVNCLYLIFKEMM